MEICRHRREVYPSPIRGQWKIGCTCGWAGLLDPQPGETTETRSAALNDLFVQHVPEDERRTYVLVDRRPGSEGTWIMPEGVAVNLIGHFKVKGVYRARVREFVHDAKTIFLPIGEIRTEDGRVFRLD